VYRASPLIRLFWKLTLEKKWHSPLTKGWLPMIASKDINGIAHLRNGKLTAALYRLYISHELITKQLPNHSKIVYNTIIDTQRSDAAEFVVSECRIYRIQTKDQRRH